MQLILEQHFLNPRPHINLSLKSRTCIWDFFLHFEQKGKLLWCVTRNIDDRAIHALFLVTTKRVFMRATMGETVSIREQRNPHATQRIKKLSSRLQVCSNVTFYRPYIFSRAFVCSFCSRIIAHNESRQNRRAGDLFPIRCCCYFFLIFSSRTLSWWPPRLPLVVKSVAVATEKEDLAAENTERRSKSRDVFLFLPATCSINHLSLEWICCCNCRDVDSMSPASVGGGRNNFFPLSLSLYELIRRRRALPEISH